jgi:hypothetical protein
MKPAASAASLCRSQTGLRLCRSLGLFSSLLILLPFFLGVSTFGTMRSARAASLQGDPPCIVPAQIMARVELFFGSGGGVTPRTFAAFLAREVTPRFPDGLSLFEGYGQWRDGAARISRERSRLLLIYYRFDAASSDKIEAIRLAYKKRFRQKSVLRADSSACVAF